MSSGRSGGDSWGCSSSMGVFGVFQGTEPGAECPRRGLWAVLTPLLPPPQRLAEVEAVKLHLGEERDALIQRTLEQSQDLEGRRVPLPHPALGWSCRPGVPPPSLQGLRPVPYPCVPVLCRAAPARSAGEPGAAAGAGGGAGALPEPGEGVRPPGAGLREPAG